MHENNLAANWKLWKQMWHHYTVVTEMENSQKSDSQKKSFFICVLGIEALQICDPEDGDNIDNIIQKLDIYILRDVSETMEVN